MSVALPRPVADGSAAAVGGRPLAVAGRWVEIRTACTTGRSPSLVGSRIAERLAADVLGVPPASLRVATLPPTGRPVVLRGGAPVACGLSIAHTHRHGAAAGLLAVAACRDGSVGIDVVAPADVAPEALARLLAADGTDPWCVAREWAAREAAYKAAALDEVFRPRRVVVDRLPDDGFRWTVGGRFRAVHGAGRFLVEGDHLVAVAVASPPLLPMPGGSSLP